MDIGIRLLEYVNASLLLNRWVGVDTAVMHLQQSVKILNPADAALLHEGEVVIEVAAYVAPRQPPRVKAFACSAGLWCAPALLAVTSGPSPEPEARCAGAVGNEARLAVPGRQFEFGSYGT